jgi:cold shock protein
MDLPQQLPTSSTNDRVRISGPTDTGEPRVVSLWMTPKTPSIARHNIPPGSQTEPSSTTSGCDTDPVITAGIVREWHSDEGWGVIDSPATAGGCWAHFGSVLADGYRSLKAGQAVSFEFESGPQDGYDYRAVAVWTGDDRPADPVRHQPSAAYSSILRLDFNAPTGDDPPDQP